MKYDVVIRCKNEMEWLPRVLSSLNNQTIKPSRIIVVDDASNDGSFQYAEQMGCVVLNYDRPEFNYSYALNLGIGETDADQI